MRKVILVFLFSIIFTSCKSVESQQTTNSNANIESNVTKAEETPVEEAIPILTKEQKQNLDRKIPLKVREILDKADEINIYYNINKETKVLGILMFKTVPNSVAKISDASLKKHFLEAFYYDVSSSESGAACYSPRHRIITKYKNKTAELNVCYHCRNFEGTSSFGNFSGGFAYESKSSKIMDEIIENHGTDLQ